MSRNLASAARTTNLSSLSTALSAGVCQYWHKAEILEQHRRDNKPDWLDVVEPFEIGIAPHVGCHSDHPDDNVDKGLAAKSRR